MRMVHGIFMAQGDISGFFVLHAARGYLWEGVTLEKHDQNHAAQCSVEGSSVLAVPLLNSLENLLFYVLCCALCFICGGQRGVCGTENTGFYIMCFLFFEYTNNEQKPCAVWLVFGKLPRRCLLMGIQGSIEECSSETCALWRALMYVWSYAYIRIHIMFTHAKASLIYTCLTTPEQQSGSWKWSPSVEFREINENWASQMLFWFRSS